MGKGIELAEGLNPEYAKMIDDLKDQLLIAFLNRLGGKLVLSTAEIDNTGHYNMVFSLLNGTFTFETVEKPFVHRSSVS